MKPFDFQVQCLHDVYQCFQQGFQRVVLIAGCGAGKTFMAGMMLHAVTSRPDRRCLFLVDRNTLLEQSATEFQGLGIHCAILQGDRPVDWDAPVIVASCQTIETRLKNAAGYEAEMLQELIGNPSLVIADECHETAWRPSFDYLDALYTPNGTKILGLTATPWRTRQDEYLGQKFDVAIEAPQPPELVKLGRIVPCRGFSLEGIFDYRSLRVARDGDFEEKDLERQALRPEALQLIVTEWIDRANGLPTAAFCSSVNHAKQLAEAFKQAGIAADYQDGETPDKIRKQQDQALSSGQLSVLCSVGTMGKGWNNKSIQCVLFTFPTQSKARFFQGAGRGSRADGMKHHYLLLDFGGNQRHGSPTGFHNYSIAPQFYDRGEPELKVCPYCSYTCSINISLCPECGYRFSGSRKKKIPDIDLESVVLVEHLTEVEREQLRFLRHAKRTCYQHNLNPELAVQQFQKRFGFEPYPEWHLHAVLGEKPGHQAQMAYLQYLRGHNSNAGWFTVQVHLEFGKQGKPLWRTRPEPNWWEILGVPPNASRETAQEAYLRLFDEIESNGSDAYQINRINWAIEVALQRQPNLTY